MWGQWSVPPTKCTFVENSKGLRHMCWVNWLHFGDTWKCPFPQLSKMWGEILTNAELITLNLKKGCYHYLCLRNSFHIFKQKCITASAWKHGSIKKEIQFRIYSITLQTLLRHVANAICTIARLFKSCNCIIGVSSGSSLWRIK